MEILGLIRIFRGRTDSPINTGASARWKDAPQPEKLFKQFVGKLLKCLIPGGTSLHHAKAPVLTRAGWCSDFRCALLVMASMWLIGTTVAVAQDQRLPEYQVKAAFIINLPKYVEWPANSFTNSTSPIVIAVLGETKVAEEIQKVIAGRNVNGREIIFTRVESGGEPAICHILFISASEQKHSPNLLAKLKNTNVLTVGESDDFLEHGGIINLARRDQKIVLEVSLDTVDQSPIKISSRLLRAATVKGKSK